MNCSHDSDVEHIQRGMGSFGLTANLLNHHIDLVSVLHVEILGGGVLVESFAVEEEPHIAHIQLNMGRNTLCL